MSLGVKALATYPLKSSKRDPGLRDVPVSFAGDVLLIIGNWTACLIAAHRHIVVRCHMSVPQHQAKRPPTFT
jgi:hypothetical protein